MELFVKLPELQVACREVRPLKAAFIEMPPALETRLAAPPKFNAFGKVIVEAEFMVVVPPAERLDRKLKFSAFEAAGLTRDTDPVPVALMVVLAVEKSSPRRAPECCCAVTVMLPFTDESVAFSKRMASCFVFATEVMAFIEIAPDPVAERLGFGLDEPSPMRTAR